MSIAVRYERFIPAAKRKRGKTLLSIERRSKAHVALSGGNS
jgi:hypothetical protein